MPKVNNRKNSTALRLFSSTASIKRSTAGFTLVELILYVTLVGILLTAGAIFASDVVYSSVKGRVRAKVQHEATFAMEKMRQEIVQAKDIKSQNSIWVLNTNTVKKFNASSGAQSNVSITTINGLSNMVYDSIQNAIWVINNTSNTLQKFDAATGTQIGGDIATGDFPTGITFDYKLNAIWVSNHISNTLQKFDAATGIQIGGNIATGVEPNDIAYDPTQNAVWVVNNISNTLQKFDAATGTQIGGDIIVANFSDNVIYDSIQNAVWIADDVAFQRFDAATGTQIGGDIEPGGLITRFVYDFIQNAIWATNNFNNTLQKFDAATGTQIGGDIATGVEPNNIAYDPTQNAVWVVNNISNTLQKFDAATGTQIGGDIATGIGPLKVIYDLNGCAQLALFDSNNILSFSINGDGSSSGILQKCVKSGSACTSADLWQDLTSPEVEVTNFVCQNISSGTSLGEEAVKIQMTLKNKNPGGKKEFDAEVNLETSISLRL